MFLALLQIARPYDQGALRVGGRYRELPGALVSPVEAMDERTRHLGVEFKIEVAHGGSSVLTQQRSRVRPLQNELFESWPPDSACVGETPAKLSVGQGRQFCRIATVLMSAAGVLTSSCNSGVPSQSLM